MGIERQTETKSVSSKKYKTRELKIHSSPEWLAESKRKYRSVFDQMEITYIYVEFSFYNKLFDEEDWNATINLKAYNMDFPDSPEELCNFSYEKKISKDDNIVYINDSWGNENAGNYWKKGTFLWEAWIDGKLVKTKYFYVENFGLVTSEANPYFNVQSLKLYEEPAAGNTPRDERTYYTKFSSKETRYIMYEFIMENLHPETDWYGELFFNFYNDVRQLKAQIVELKHIPAGTQLYAIDNGWGTDKKTFWYEDLYTLEVVFMDQLIAIIPFQVGDAFEVGETEPILVEKEGQYFPRTESEDEELSETEAMQQLEELIGLKDIKQRIKDYKTYLQFEKLRIEKGLEDTDKLNLHLVFTGNPGTGKTTVAKMLGKIYKSMGLLPKSTVHEVDRSDLVAEFIGQTAPKTKQIINKARGGILFIDEAYALVRKDDEKDFGREALEIIIKELSDGPGDLAIIFAGYPEEMETFINSNPGLKSRLKNWYDFTDYTPEELSEISEYTAHKRNLLLNVDAKELLHKKVLEAYRNRDKYFGNARYVNSLIEEAKVNLGLRVMKSPDPNSLSLQEISTITLDDIQKVFEAKEPKFIDIPIDEDLLKEVITEMNNLIDLAKIKNEVNEQIKLVRFYKESKKDVLNAFSLHNVFIGNPGTGKTTLARIFAKLYKALGLLERGHLVECSRECLVAGYVGQTAIKTAEKIKEAMGGVLFIDEAYALTSYGGNNDFGHEAIEVILKEMEDHRGQFAVIVAGYTDEMKLFLDSNPGLRSRFDNLYKFEDYKPEELLEIALKMLADEQIKPTPKALEHLKNYFDFHYKNKDKFFGNARVVRKIAIKSIKNQQLRLSNLPKEKRTAKVIETLTLEDVKEFHSSKDILISRDHKQIGFIQNDVKN